MKIAIKITETHIHFGQIQEFSAFFEQKNIFVSLQDF